MNKIYLLAVFFLSAHIALCQSADSVKKQKQVRYYKQKLGIAEEQAGQVNALHDRYKASLKTITDDPSLSEPDKRKAAERLMEEKNKKLSSLLRPDQLDALVPTSERKRSKRDKKKDLIVTRRDTVRLRDQMNTALVIPKDKAQQVTFVQLSYKQNLRQVLADTALSGPDKQFRLTQLTRERNRKLKGLLTPQQLNKIVPSAEQKL